MTNRLMMVTCAFASALTVQASTWTGAAGDDWTAPGNWNGTTAWLKLPVNSGLILLVR